MKHGLPKRCSYDELGGICNVPIADNAEFCENHVQKSRENTHWCVAVTVVAILFLGFVMFAMCSTP